MNPASELAAVFPKLSSCCYACRGVLRAKSIASSSCLVLSSPIASGCWVAFSYPSQRSVADRVLWPCKTVQVQGMGAARRILLAASQPPARLSPPLYRNTSKTLWTGLWTPRKSLRRSEGAAFCDEAAAAAAAATMAICRVEGQNYKLCFSASLGLAVGAGSFRASLFGTSPSALAGNAVQYD